MTQTTGRRRRLFCGTACATALAFMGLAPAGAQINDLATGNTDIVAVGTRINDVRKDALTSPVSVISTIDIEARAQTYVADLLRSLPGVAVNQSGPTGNLTQIRIRGSEANHVLVLIDGIEASNPNTGEFDFAGLRSEDILKIEVLRGEQSALYGSDAVGGVISIVTRSASIQPRYVASIEAGSFDTLDGQVSAVIPIGSAALSVNGGVLTTEGYDISGLNGEDDGSESRNLNIGLNGVNLGPITLSARGSVSKLVSEFDGDNNFDGRLENTDDELTTDTQSAQITAKFTVAGFDSQLGFSYLETDTANPFASFPNDTSGRRTKLDWVITRTWNAHTLTVLGETESERFSNFGGLGAGQNQTESIRNEALAADYRFNQGDISITASARQDFNDRFDDAFTWRVGAGYSIDALGGRIRGSYGTGVKNPTLTELFGFFPAFFTGNPDLTPETSEGFSLGYEQSLLDEQITLSLDYFNSDLEDEIFTDFSVFPSTARNNTTDSTREGIEIEGRWAVSDTVDLRGSATFLEAEENGVEELRRPDFLASLTGTWQPLPALRITGSIDHTGSQVDTDFATFSPVTLDAFTLVGLNVAYDMNDIITLSLRGDNLLDEDYQEVVGFASKGRGIYGGLTARF